MTVYTLTLNPCVDRTINIDRNVEKGGTYSVSFSTKDISGKGINVSKVLHSWGRKTHCLGIDYNAGVDNVKTELNNLYIPNTLKILDGSLRTNTKVFEIPTGSMTEFNERGNEITEDKITEVTQMIYAKIDDMDRGDILVLTGSMPPGFSSAYYYELISYARKKGIKTALDASGNNLIEGAKACPYILKPNLNEFKTLTGLDTDKVEDLVKAGWEFIQKGIEYLCITLGDKGTILLHDNNAYFAKPYNICVKGVQGAGDSVLAGMCAAIEDMVSDEDILKYGVSAALGSLIHEGTKMCTLEDFNRFTALVSVSKISS